MFKLSLRPCITRRKVREEGKKSGEGREKRKETEESVEWLQGGGKRGLLLRASTLVAEGLLQWINLFKGSWISRLDARRLPTPSTPDVPSSSARSTPRRMIYSFPSVPSPPLPRANGTPLPNIRKIVGICSAPPWLKLNLDPDATSARLWIGYEKEEELFGIIPFFFQKFRRIDSSRSIPANWKLVFAIISLFLSNTRARTWTLESKYNSRDEIRLGNLIGYPW